MLLQLHFLLFMCLIAVSNQVLQRNVSQSIDDGKSSLAFVFDTTGSMYDDLKQLREGAEMILDTAMQGDNVISNFVFVPFHDPVVGPATVTRDKAVFKSALNIVRVYGGGDCPERALGGVLLALSVSLPRSFVYVFTDATAGDHRLAPQVLDAVQQKQTQVVFVLTGHCNDLHKPHYKVYQQIAAASSGQVFNLNKTSVHKVLEFVKSSITGRNVNLGSLVNPPGYNYTQEIPVDSTVGEVTVSVSGAKPQIKVVNPSGEALTGPPKLITTLDLSEIMVVKVLEPEPGNWSITVGSEEAYSVKVVGLSNLTFHHGFSVERPQTMSETSYRPLQGTDNYMMISLTQVDAPVTILYAEILSLSGKVLFELPLKEVDAGNKIYLAEAFMPPDEFFYISINGHDESNQELRRIGATAVQTKSPDVPYLTVAKTIKARLHDRVVLSCKIESLVPITAQWTKGATKVQSITRSQSTELQYVIEDMSEDDIGSYRCFAKNVAGLSKAFTEVSLLVDPPLVKLSPENATVMIGDMMTVSCVVLSETSPSVEILLNGSPYVDDVNVDTADGHYNHSVSLAADEKHSGRFSCRASNQGGVTTKHINVTVLTQPTAAIISPRTLSQRTHTDTQLACHTTNAQFVRWIAPDGTIVGEGRVDLQGNSVLDRRDLTVEDDGTWMCVAVRNDVTANDTIYLEVTIEPLVLIDGPKNMTLAFGLDHEFVCKVTAKPKPTQLVWRAQNGTVLNSEVTTTKPNEYSSRMTLKNVSVADEGRYYCLAENSEGSYRAEVAVSIRKAMKIVQGFSDTSTELYSQMELQCKIEAYPTPKIIWYHNHTELQDAENVRVSADKTTLYIQMVDFHNLGFYECRAENTYENLVINGTLNVVGLALPRLQKEPETIVVRKGDSVKITCRILHGNPEPEITWQFKSMSSSDFVSLRSNVMSDVDINILHANLNHAGTYRCEASNIIGKDLYEVSLAVQYAPELELTNTIDDLLQELKAGERVMFSCKAIGNPTPILVWSKNDQPVAYSQNVYLIDDTTLVIDKATADDSGVFTCTAKSALGSTEKNFPLLIYVPPTIAPLEQDPQHDVIEGQLVELPCSARGVPKPEREWLQNGQTIERGGRKYIDEEFVLRFVANVTDFGDYTCIARNKYGNTSHVFQVYVWVPPRIEPPIDIKQEVLSGSNVSLQCNAVGFPLPTISWEFQGSALLQNTTDLSFNAVGELYISHADAQHEGTYTCAAENIAGVTHKTISLVINTHPNIIAENYAGPYEATDMDSVLSIACRAVGKPKPFVIWARDGYFIDKDSRFDIENNGNLLIKSPTEDLSGSYTCMAKNKVGSANKTVEVKIYSLSKLMQADQQAAKISIVEWATASIECPLPHAEGDHVKWYKDAQLLSTEATLYVPFTRRSAGSYACTVSNVAGSLYSTVLVSVEWPPSFTTNSTRNVQLLQGGDQVLGCDADASPSAKTKWYFNKRLMLGEDREFLRVMSVKLHQAGSYECAVSNPHGTIVRHFTLDVLEKPFISDFDVLDVELKEGTNASLDCIARGFPEPTITWKYNNTAWRLENTSIVAMNVTQVSAGAFACSAANAAGRARLVYRVAVVAPARVSRVDLYDGRIGLTTDRGQALLHSELRVACYATGHPAPKVQWLRNGNTVSANSKGISYADLAFERVDNQHSGFYSCVASNDLGVDERRFKLEVLEPPRIATSLIQETNPSETTRSLEILSGHPFYLHCHPYGNPVPHVYWFKDGVSLKMFDDSLVSKDFGEMIVSGNAHREQTGNYTCVARNDVGEAAFSYLVDVLEPPPKPKEELTNIRIREGQPLNLTCPVLGSPKPSVMWVKQPYVRVSEDLMPNVKLLDDNITLLITPVSTADSGKYTCVLTNKVGTSEVTYSVSVERPPSVGSDAQSQTVPLGRSVIMNCEADGEPMPAVQWYKVTYSVSVERPPSIGSDAITQTVPLGRSVIMICGADGEPMPAVHWYEDARLLHGNSSTIHRVLENRLLTIWRVDTRHAGQFVCVAENSAGIAYKRFNLMVQVPGKWSNYSAWSYCNATCGLGHQHRQRTCQYIDDQITIDSSMLNRTDNIVLDESACKGPKVDKRKCHMPPCEEEETVARWSVWSKWSDCSASCGVGTQTRSRRCKTASYPCHGDNVQIRKCPDLPPCDSAEETFDNDIQGSRELVTENNPLLPDATFEFEPEVFQPNNPQNVGKVFELPDSQTLKSHYDVIATENIDDSDALPCGAGYRQNEHTLACEDIDECPFENNQCHSSQMCENIAGGYRCSCQSGYVSMAAGQRCLDINECSQELHGCEFACVNVAGGYVCACPAPLRLHRDRHHCVPVSYPPKPHFSYEEFETSEYLSASIESPTRYQGSRSKNKHHG